MAKIKEMIGKKYGRLLVIEMRQKTNNGYSYLCLCDCGNQKVLNGSAIRTGAVKSCGCIRSEMIKAKNFKHGKSYTPEYRSMCVRQSGMKRKLRMPKWADKEAIKKFYLNKPPNHQVDHIIPLNGKFVSGLHVESNLQYLPPEENRRKSNLYSIER